MATALHRITPTTNGILRHPATTVVACFRGGHKAPRFIDPLARPSQCDIVVFANRSHGGSMRQQTKPFIVERKPSRKPKPDVQKPSIWGRLGGDIAQGLKDQRNMEQVAATGGDERI
jgi:hypothetical protein